MRTTDSSPAVTRVRLGGHDLEVALIEPATAGRPWLVFLHDALGSLTTWRDFPARLARATGYGALVYSRHGNGFSTPLSRPRDPDYMHVEALEVLPALLAALDIARPCLVGHSDGASIALMHAGVHEVRSVILEAPHVFVEPLTRAGIDAARADFGRGPLRALLSRHHADVDRTFSGWCDAWLSEEFRDWNIESFLAGTTCPVLLIQGEHDEYGTLAQLDAVEHQVQGPVTRLELPCGHIPHRERETDVLDAMTEFLAGTGPG